MHTFLEQERPAEFFILEIAAGIFCLENSFLLSMLCTPFFNSTPQGFSTTSPNSIVLPYYIHQDSALRLKAYKKLIVILFRLYFADDFS